MTLLFTDAGYVVPAVEYEALRAERNRLAAELAKAREERDQYKVLRQTLAAELSDTIQRLNAELAKAREALQRIVDIDGPRAGIYGNIARYALAVERYAMDSEEGMP